MENLVEYEEKAIITFADRFTTVSLSPYIVGERASGIAQKVNCHHHTMACRKYGTTCRFKFPKFPVWETLLAQPTKNENEYDKNLVKEYENLLKKVRQLLLDEDVMKEINSECYQPNSLEEYKANRERKIKMLLKKAGLKEDNFDFYISALKYTKTGFQIIPARDVDEIFVNSYCPEWAENWNGNTDIQLTPDFYSVITYITEYYTKDDTGTIQHLKDALKEDKTGKLKDKMALMMNTFISLTDG